MTRLGCNPQGTSKSLRGEHQSIEDMTLPANEEIVLDNVTGNAIELNLTFDPVDAAMLEVNVLRSSDKSEYTRIAFYP